MFPYRALFRYVRPTMSKSNALENAAPPLLTLDDVRAAAARIGDAVVRTPTDYSKTLSQITGANIWLKFENLQFTAAYKERGALNKLLLLTEEQKARGVITASAGNHSQGLAYHGTRLGVPVTIVMLLLSARMGRLAQRIGPRLPMTIGPIVAGGGLALYTRIDPSASYVTDVLPAVVIFALGPLAIGLLVRTRARLTEQLTEVRLAREDERRQAAEVALSRERALLAREMHDVVSHQVTLIAVQAGAVQVAGRDEAERGFARTIRQLCVVTLQELREMVQVLRASGGTAREIAPQPVLADLPRLIADSGLETTATVDLPESLGQPVQRAVYRFVQEGLTNVRKHAPDAAVRVTEASIAIAEADDNRRVTAAPVARTVLRIMPARVPRRCDRFAKATSSPAKAWRRRRRP